MENGDSLSRGRGYPARVSGLRLWPASSTAPRRIFRFPIPLSDW
jgi:hypothetical protein